MYNICDAHLLLYQVYDIYLNYYCICYASILSFLIFMINYHNYRGHPTSSDFKSYFGCPTNTVCNNSSYL